MSMSQLSFKTISILINSYFYVAGFSILAITHSTNVGLRRLKKLLKAKTKTYNFDEETLG